MTITTLLQMDAYARITPADPLSGQTYQIGIQGETFTIPSDADLVISRQLTTASGSQQTYEPDVNNWNSEGVVADPDGGVVDMATLYLMVLRNPHASLSATFVCANMDSGNSAGTLQPTGFAAFFFPSGISLGATSTVGLTGVAGTPIIDVLLIGVAT